jgi:hypothetical protein
MSKLTELKQATKQKQNNIPIQEPAPTKQKLFVDPVREESVRGEFAFRIRWMQLTILYGIIFGIWALLASINRMFISAVAAALLCLISVTLYYYGTMKVNTYD